MKLLVKNWRDFQHYKQRRPPWIRLHHKLLDDFAFQRLQVASRALAPMLWLLASESMDGVIEASPEEIAFRLRQTTPELMSALKPLIDAGFFELASGVLADCKQSATPETETETETETEKAMRGKAAKATPPKPVRSPRGARLALDWQLPKAWGEWALSERKGWTADWVRQVAERFADYWHAATGQSASKADWQATWRNWVRRESDPPAAAGGPPRRNGADAWWSSEDATLAKAAEVGVTARGGESWDALRGRIRAALAQGAAT